MNNIVVYTAIFGDRDFLQTPILFKGVSYVCFTDNPAIMSDVWKIVYVPPTEEHPRRQAKIFKILPHLYFPEFTYSIWVDATHIPKVHPRKLINQFLRKENIALFKHHKRNCIYDEAEECVALGLDDKDIIRNQILNYKNAGYPEQNGLSTCTVIFRKHNDANVITAMEKWWSEIKDFSMRDQISFNYVMHTLKTPFYEIKMDVYKNPFFQRFYHIGTPEFYRRLDQSNDGNNSYLVKLGINTLGTFVFVDRCFGRLGGQLKVISPKLYYFLKRKFYFKTFYLLLDRYIGKAGIIINKISPSLYNFLKKKMFK
jgi:hypothetical protein